MIPPTIPLPKTPLGALSAEKGAKSSEKGALSAEKGAQSAGRVAEGTLESNPPAPCITQTPLRDIQSAKMTLPCFVPVPNPPSEKEEKSEILKRKLFNYAAEKKAEPQEFCKKKDLPARFKACPPKIAEIPQTGNMDPLGTVPEHGDQSGSSDLGDFHSFEEGAGGTAAFASHRKFGPMELCSPPGVEIFGTSGPDFSHNGGRGLGSNGESTPHRLVRPGQF